MQAPTVIAMANSETTRFSVTWVTVICLSGDVRVPIFLAHSLEVIISILNSMIHDDADFLSWRAFFRYPLRCYCRLFVSDYVPFSFSNQLVAIGSRMKWRFRQLLFPSANWFGDEIWLFDPGIFRIDNEDELKTCFTLPPVHNAVSRQRQRIGWRKIMLYLILRISHGTLLLCISVSIKDLGRPPVVSLILGGCISGTRFTKWLSSLPQSWSLAITKKDFVWKRSLQEIRVLIAQLYSVFNFYAIIEYRKTIDSVCEKVNAMVGRARKIISEWRIVLVLL